VKTGRKQWFTLVAEQHFDLSKHSDPAHSSDTTVPGFKSLVEAMVRQIPRGRVMTYGQLAALAGSARAARIVGGIAHFGDPDLPWQRVVNKQGGLAAGYPGGRAGHRAALEAEGVYFNDKDQVDVQRLIWWPS
jgi:methylated-DNA-protein-cysteine methyltransferase-like protein